MSATVITPTAPTSGGGSWTLNGSGNPCSCILAQGDGQYHSKVNYESSGDGPVMGSFGLASIPDDCTIDSIDGYYFASRSGTNAGNMEMRWSLGGAYVNGTKRAPVLEGYTQSAMARPGGGAWTRADLASLLVKFYAYGDAGIADRQVKVDQMYIRVNWTPAPDPPAPGGIILFF